jgi:hypothetical protein
MSDIKIDLNPIVGAILSVFIEPYQDFVSDMHADGRITAAELEALDAALRDRRDRLADLVAERLKQSESPDRGPAKA